MTIEPTEFDMIALARRGLQALYDEGCAGIEFAQGHARIDPATMDYTAESKEAQEQAYEVWSAAYDRFARFNVLHPERVAA
ncbi:hypothetical protein [Methylobacterium dankookense]|jgi:hypothetical protein|uniref:Uncharacterized protein n=1 Tax=Methylobacterium dankookense TaxID=560405 RepID=A0A564FXX5_9HYPH|nr:hypothetical protein [Methylobacterium dankookense]GJD54334.1 hypothetical protein IFDJLNFL_0205 [Methylobacterium dankookense]VUF13029.1 hypothetical protein MTDSW087_02727 [Methylobacterium dankookense]